jgi:hypothetical protein
VANAVLDPRGGPGVAQPKVHMLFNVETAWRLCTWVIIVRCWFTSAVSSDMAPTPSLWQIRRVGRGRLLRSAL